MSSSVLSNNNCGPVTGLLSNQTFLLHAQTPQKTISPPPLWRTFYAPPPAPFPPSAAPTTTQNNSLSNYDTRGSQLAQQITLNLKTSPKNFHNDSSVVNLPNQRMTLQKLPNSSTEQTTQVANTQKSIMSVSKLVRPTPKSQHTHQHQHQHQHLTLHPQATHLHAQQQPPQPSAQQHHYINDMQTGPINLVTNSQTDAERSRPSSNSSVDIESDDIPAQTQQQHLQQQQNLAGVVVSTAASIPVAAAYPFDYSHLYANKSSYHNALVDTHRLHAPPFPTYAAMAAAIAATSPNNNNVYAINPALNHHQSIALAPPPPSPLPVSTATGTVVVTSKISPSSIDYRQQHQNQNQHHHHHHHHHQQQHHHNQQHSQEQQLRLNNSNEHMFSPPLPAAPPTALSNGTYLNCKSSPASDSADSSTENYFKVPNISSGKEGSLKHRILTRPNVSTEKDARSTNDAVISTYNSTANFKKGSYIELDNGLLRRVEDMRTEDFIQAAERNIHLQMAESTVVKIDTTKPNMVMITFSYDRNRSKADLEVSVDHPFFVYGQGWASCDPEKSHKAFGLKCQRLQVGDICISLTQRTTPPVTIKMEISTKEESLRYMNAEMTPTNAEAAISLTMPIKNEQQQAVMPPPALQHATNLTTTSSNAATAATIFSRPPAHFMPCHMLTTALPPHQMPYPDFAELVAAATAYNNSAQLHHMQTAMPPPPSPDAINGYYQQTQQLYLQGKVTAADLRLQASAVAPPPPPPTTPNYCPPPRSTLLPPLPSQHHSPMLEHTQEQPFDASVARKRRWSAPEGDCDGAQVERDHCQNSKIYKAAIAPVTS